MGDVRACRKLKINRKPNNFYVYSGSNRIDSVFRCDIWPGTLSENTYMPSIFPIILTCIEYLRHSVIRQSRQDILRLLEMKSKKGYYKSKVSYTISHISIEFIKVEEKLASALQEEN